MTMIERMKRIRRLTMMKRLEWVRGIYEMSREKIGQTAIKKQLSLSPYSSLSSLPPSSGREEGGRREREVEGERSMRGEKEGREREDNRVSGKRGGTDDQDRGNRPSHLLILS